MQLLSVSCLDLTKTNGQNPGDKHVSYDLCMRYIRPWSWLDLLASTVTKGDKACQSAEQPGLHNVQPHLIYHIS